MRRETRAVRNAIRTRPLSPHTTISRRSSPSRPGPTGALRAPLTAPGRRENKILGIVKRGLRSVGALGRDELEIQSDKVQPDPRTDAKMGRARTGHLSRPADVYGRSTRLKAHPSRNCGFVTRGRGTFCSGSGSRSVIRLRRAPQGVRGVQRSLGRGWINRGSVPDRRPVASP